MIATATHKLKANSSDNVAATITAEQLLNCKKKKWGNATPSIFPPSVPPLPFPPLPAAKRLPENQLGDLGVL